MTAYEAYMDWTMEKLASSAVYRDPHRAYLAKLASRRIDREIEYTATPVDNVSRNGVRTTGVQHQARWKADGQILGDLDVEYRNRPGGAPLDVPPNTASVDWIKLHLRDAIKAKRSAAMRDLASNMLNRAAWRAKQDGMSNVMGDAGARFSHEGRKYTGEMVAMVAKHTPVSMVKAPLGDGETPIAAVDPYFEGKQRENALNRQAQACT